MQRSELVKLIKPGVAQNGGGIWADFGSGDGAFTLALREIAGPDVEIYSIDQDTERLNGQKEVFAKEFPETQLHFLNADFTKSLELPLLDGLIAANSIHFQKDHVSVFKKLASYLKPGGTFIVIEYNADTGNMYVPYPFSYASFEKIALDAGLYTPELLATYPSTMLKEMYAARATKP